MKHTDFWFSLDKFKSLLPKSLDSKLNMLSLIVVLVTVILGLLKVQYFWLFGIIGLLTIIMYREYHNEDYEDYESSEVEGPDYYDGYPGEIMPYPCMNTGLAAGCNPDFEELRSSFPNEWKSFALPRNLDFETCSDVNYDPNPGINNTGNTFDEIYGNVRDQVTDSRFPKINQSGCRQEYYVG
jgi:hypothetical protein